MKNLAYFLIAILFLTVSPVSAEDENKGCKWETVEETEQFIREQCIGDGQLQVRMKSKPVPGVTVIEAPNTKKSNPLKEIKEVVKSKEAKKQEKKIEKIEQAIEDTAKKVEEVKKETVVKKQETKVEKEKSKKSNWKRPYQLLPELILNNEKIQAAELDYDAALETLKSEYSAYKPQVSVSIGQNWEDDRTPAKGTYPNNTITHDSKNGLTKSITITQMLWDAGRTSSVVDKAKHTAQQAYFRLDQAKEDLMVEALNAWINLGKAYNNWQSNMKVQKNAMTTLKMTTEKVKKGEASKMEQLQIEQQFRTYQTLTMTSKLAYDSAVERFRTVWKFTPKNIDQMPMPVSDLLGMIPEAGTNVKNNTTIKIASMDVKIAEQQLRFDNADFKPRVDGKLSYTEKEGELGGGFDNEQKEEWRADITMTWQVFGGFKKTHVYRADKSRLKAAEIRLTDTVNATQEQFNNSWNNYVLVEKNLKTLKRTVEINQEMYNLTLADFKAGNTPIMAVFGMKTSLIMSEVAYQNAQLDLTIARYQLHKLLGIVNPLFKQ
jgi:outer membrane protein TolC